MGGSSHLFRVMFEFIFMTVSVNICRDNVEKKKKNNGENEPLGFCWLDLPLVW